MKYHVKMIDVVCVFTVNSRDIDIGRNSSAASDLVNAISDGYELISAVSCGNSEVGKIQYIVRKPAEENT